MAKLRMRDLVILLPGITGSVLQKDGKDLWAISGQAAWSALVTLGSALQRLKLSGDDPAIDDLGDGVRAVRVMADAHLVPGLVKIDGYSGMSRLVAGEFEVVAGSIENGNPANFFEFPYDWRRDNRCSARRLQAFIRDRLPLWRKHSGAADAKVIFLAHSMGGLVARYYLEVLEGWRDCRALVTFGTPYRGSVNAVDFLANGYKKLFLDLTDMMRSFTSVYQLLPIYKVLECGGSVNRIAETDGVPGIAREKAEDALEFHREIEQAVSLHQGDPEYAKAGYRIVPVVGTRQPTLQSACLANGRVVTSRTLPSGIDPLLDDGDGTVPYLSAIPIELSAEYRESYIPERHGCLQNNLQMLNELRNRLRQMQIPGLGAIRGPEISADREQGAAIALDLEDIYVAGDPVLMRARLVNYGDDPGGMGARIQPLAGGPAVKTEFRELDGEWVLERDQMPPGLYRVEVGTRKAGPASPPAVHDIFEILKQ